MNKTIKTCTHKEYFDRIIKSQKTTIQDLLLANGWKVKAIPNVLNGEDITIYEKGKETIVHYEPTDFKKFIAYDVKIRYLVFRGTKEKRK